ncbi:MAG: LAGLIDADG endonuclease [Patescibacteria group bacterium]
MANTKQIHKLRSSITLSDLQRACIIGTVLGDGSLIPTFSKNNLRLQIDQCEKQREYVLWKYAILSSLVLTPPAFRQQTKSWRFRTISHPELTFIGDLFYEGRRKKVPENIESVCTDPISLAVWFMDDGAKNRNDGLILNTQCFTKQETERLKDCLKRNFDLSHVSLHKDKNGWRLYIQKESTCKMMNLIEPFIIPCMKYKMISPVETTRRLPEIVLG